MTPLKRKPRFLPLELTAYHEAGHAVARLHFRHSIRKVSIVAGEDYLGHVVGFHEPAFRPDIAIDDKTQRKIRERVMILFAGGAAEAHRAGRHNHIGTQSDYRSAVDLAYYACCSPESVKHYLDWLRIESRAFVRQPLNWIRIEAVAVALLERKMLTGKDVTAIVSSAKASFLCALHPIGR